MKNLYLIIVTIGFLYLLYKEYNNSNIKSIVINDNILDSTIIVKMQNNADSLSRILSSSDEVVTKRIDMASSTIKTLKTEVSNLKVIIKQKDKQINELKNTINNFTNNLNSKFRLFAIDSQNRQ